MSFGSRLRELRIEKGISQKAVAADMGVSITTISQYESDSRFPNKDILRRLCIYYKILLVKTNNKLVLEYNWLSEKIIFPKNYTRFTKKNYIVLD